MERSEAERLAETLNWLVREGKIPGLLPKDVSRAAGLLVEQEAELKTLRAAAGAKDHLVMAEATSRNYRTDIRATFVISDPRIYYGEVTNDSYVLEQGGDNLIRHQARALVAVATKDWMNDLHERAYVAVRKAVTNVKRDAA